MNRPDWDTYFMLLAKLTASRSTCLSRPTGAVVVRDNQILATGYNGSLPNQPHCSDAGTCFRRSKEWPDGMKYDMCRSSHAEANAVALAAKKGLSTEGATMYCTLEPCLTCSKLIIISGITRVVFEHAYESVNQKRDLFWKETLKKSNVAVEQLSIDKNMVDYIHIFVDNETSRRRI